MRGIPVCSEIATLDKEGFSLFSSIKESYVSLSKLKTFPLFSSFFIKTRLSPSLPVYVSPLFIFLGKPVVVCFGLSADLVTDFVVALETHLYINLELDSLLFLQGQVLDLLHLIYLL